MPLENCRTGMLKGRRSGGARCCALQGWDLRDVRHCIHSSLYALLACEFLFLSYRPISVEISILCYGGEI